MCSLHSNHFLFNADGSNRYWQNKTFFSFVVLAFTPPTVICLSSHLEIFVFFRGQQGAMFSQTAVQLSCLARRARRRLIQHILVINSFSSSSLLIVIYLYDDHLSLQETIITWSIQGLLQRCKSWSPALFYTSFHCEEYSSDYCRCLTHTVHQRRVVVCFYWTEIELFLSIIFKERIIVQPSNFIFEIDRQLHVDKSH